nr:hypothetical protein [Corynebacterium lactis]
MHISKSLVAWTLGLGAAFGLYAAVLVDGEAATETVPTPTYASYSAQ